MALDACESHISRLGMSSERAAKNTSPPQRSQSSRSHIEYHFWSLAEAKTCLWERSVYSEVASKGANWSDSFTEVTEPYREKKSLAGAAPEFQFLQMSPVAPVA